MPAKFSNLLPLSQIGEFYETVGLDAVVLMQYCSLNPMGNKVFPHAGAPLVNIEQILRDLVLGAGFSVVGLTPQGNDPLASLMLPCCYCPLPGLAARSCIRTDMYRS